MNKMGDGLRQAVARFNDGVGSFRRRVEYYGTLGVEKRQRDRQSASRQGRKGAPFQVKGIG